jgi:cysteine desulfurase family protein
VVPEAVVAAGRREIYLDNAATTFPKPEPVVDACSRFLAGCGGSPARGHYPKAREAESILVSCRAGLAELFGVPDPSRFVLTTNCTEALNLAIKSLLHGGDHAVTSDMEHNAVLRPLHAVHERRGVEVTHVRAADDGRVDPEAVRAALRPSTKLVVLTHASNVLGTVQDVAAFAAVAHAGGAKLLVDGAQAAGTVPVDLVASGVDLYAFSGHKGLLGPHGTGGLYVGPGISLEPLKEGGTGTFSEDPHQPDTIPDGMESGTPNMLGFAGLAAGIGWVVDRTVAKIRAHETALAGRFLAGALAMPGVRVHGPTDADARVGLVALTVDGMDPSDVGNLLYRRANVMVRTGLHCAPLVHQRLGLEKHGTVRFGFGVFNTDEDVDVALAALSEITKAARA